MHHQDLSPWRHEHVFDAQRPAAERSTRAVMWITLAAMLAEIVAGWWFNSMALLADGWHMSSHAMALGVSAYAYAAARRLSGDPRFAFGTWKIEVLGGFASAIFLLGVAALMVIGSAERLLSPQPIQYRDAIAVAVLGLLVNAACAVILGRVHHGHVHEQGPQHGHVHHHNGHPDLNLKSAYLHVLADAATSVLAIAALAGGWVFGWAWLDPLTGIVGAVLVAMWAHGLLRQTGTVLLDREMDHPVVDEIRSAVETPGTEHGGTRVADLHAWRVGQRTYACALTVVTHDTTLTAAQVREWLSVHEEIVHATIEIHVCAAGE
ncbi:CDF family Co(II)/Ni(II) efflux transporter DmeF [Schlegelella sp. S2-27]|uniref:CDF family Co(II)/Ni(II) efflux transporter DmeF n=1 Tax=Caldimonas mangrovi TaxID=2944811 RepID=A0ABT0YJU6_9BURK|nr:CDF family Co(II)/Ni(II) efflux transporter DmeF [Caldimonas mangrovi]MCM5678928.1 CDF family Co(II)/Ni(II) efflux transporter DmeF [Caldimonas mangrovi]